MDLLWIYVIVVILMSLMILLPSTEKDTWRTSEGMKKMKASQVGKGSLDSPKASQMTANWGKITCKKCGKCFDSPEAWKKNTSCDQPENCVCPEVQLSMRRTNQAIDNAKEKAGYIVKRSEDFMPTNRAMDEHHQLWVTASPILTMEIRKQYNRRGRGGNK